MDPVADATTPGPPGAPPGRRRARWALPVVAVVVVSLLGAHLLTLRPATWDVGVYRGGLLRGSGPDAERVVASLTDLARWSAWSGEPAPTVLGDFTSAADWGGVDGYAGMFRGYAALPAGTRINLGVPILVSDEDTTLRRGAQGEYTGPDSAFRSLARNVVEAGLGGRVIYRLGWEMNAASGFRWALNGDVRSGNPSYSEGDPDRGVREFITYWRLIVEDIRAEDPAATFHFCPINGWDGTGPTPASMYPGDRWVDYVGPDVYDVDYSDGGYEDLDEAGPERTRQLRDEAWERILHGSHGLHFWRRFAHDHDKRLGIGEWGTAPVAGDDGGSVAGSGDNPEFVRRMHRFFSRSAREGVMGFDVRFDVDAHDGDFRFHPVEESPYPRAAAAYADLTWGVADRAGLLGLVADVADRAGALGLAAGAATAPVAGAPGARRPPGAPGTRRRTEP